MALKISLTPEQNNVGCSPNNAYVKIVAFNYDETNDNVSVSVNVYYNRAALLAGKSPIGGGVYSGVSGVDFPSIDGNNGGVRVILYDWLKTLPEFAGALDDV